MTSMSQRKAAAAKVAPKAAAPKAEAPKAAASKAAAPRVAKPVALKAVASKSAKAAEKTAAGNASADATKLAAEIERGLRDGKLDTLTPEAFQALMAALCKSYGAQREAGVDFLPVAD